MNDPQQHALEIARDLARRPADWAHLVAHDPARRTFALLRDDDDVTAWVICWMDDHDTGYHDHDASAGAVAVVEGRVVEERPRLGGAPSQRVAEAGDAFSFGVGDIHRVRHGGDGPAVTLHVYSPPLRGQGSYVEEADGTLRRLALSEQEELRPRLVEA